jgi:hypothetical protein
MVTATEGGLSRKPAEPLDQPIARRLLPLGQMRSQFVVVAGAAGKNPAQMGLAEDDDVIEAFPADRAISLSPIEQAPPRTTRIRWTGPIASLRSYRARCLRELRPLPARPSVRRVQAEADIVAMEAPGAVSFGSLQE